MTSPMMSPTKAGSAASSCTPVRNNYAAPHTPIASAKRPRQSGSKAQSNSNSNSNGTSSNSTPLNGIRENENMSNIGNLTTPARGTDASFNSNSCGEKPFQAMSHQMSPMHPPKPVPHGAHGKEVSSTPSSPSSSVENNPHLCASNMDGSSWMGRQVDAIFSPVLSFLNGKPISSEDLKRDLLAGDDNSGVEVDHDGDVTMADNDVIDRVDGPGEIHRIAVSNFETESNHGSLESHSLNCQNGAKLDDTPRISASRAHAHAHLPSSSPSSSWAHHHDESHSHAEDLGATSTSDNTTSSQSQPNQRVHSSVHVENDSDNINPVDSLDSAEESIDDEASEEEEFNPYLFIKSLPIYSHVVPSPQSKICLPPKSASDPPISLVLDLDETLVHCTVEPTADADMVFPVIFHGVEYKVHVRTRPYLTEFLEAVSSKFEVIVFTASQKVYANELLNRIDPEGKYIKHRMFRESCLLVEGNYLKDLNVLGRNLATSVLVDNSPHAFGYQVDNGIPIESWFDDPHDTELLKLEQFLETLHGVHDVRAVVRSKFQTYKLIRDA